MNPQGNEWEPPLLKITKTTLQRIHHDLGSQVYFHVADHENPGCEGGQGMDVARKIQAWQLDKVKSKIRFFWRHQETKRKSTPRH